MHRNAKSAAFPRHARLFELIRQQNLAALHKHGDSASIIELNSAQLFIEAASSSLKIAS